MVYDAATERKADLPRLTVEMVLYGLILCLTLATRLGGLGMRTMDEAEAEIAWQAWRLESGEMPAGRYSPLLLSGQAVLFALFGASDAAVRLWSALAGSAMVLLPYLVRHRLGRVGSLAAALSLAISPTLVRVSRHGDGAGLLLACALGAVVFWLAYRQDRKALYLHSIAVLVSLALLSDPRVVSVLIALGAAWAVERFAFRRDVFATDAQAAPLSWREWALTLGVTLALGATAFAFNPGGLGAWAEFPAAWGEHLLPVVNGQPWYYPLVALVMYEPFLLLFGVIGAVSVLCRRGPLAVLTWLGAGLLVIALLAGGRDAGDVALVCGILALLAGRAVDDLVESWRKEAAWTREGLFGLVILALLAYVGLEASFYARALYADLAQTSQFLWLWLLAIALLVILTGFSIAWFGSKATWRAGGGVLVVVLLLVTFSASTGLNFRRADDPRELHVLSASGPGTRDALEVMRDLSYHRRGAPEAMPVTVEASLGPVWRWYLRDWEDAIFVEQLTRGVTTHMVLASADRVDPALGQRYMGQDFVTQTWWQPTELNASDQLSWWLYRKSSSNPVPVRKVILWVKAEEELAGSQ